MAVRVCSMLIKAILSVNKAAECLTGDACGVIMLFIRLTVITL